MEKKYRTEPEGNLLRIIALKTFSNVKAGEEGGLIEKEENLSQEGDCWVYNAARVYGNARVWGNACVYGFAEVFDNAWVGKNAQVFDNAWVGGNALVGENAWICGGAWVNGDVIISETLIYKIL